MAIHIPKTSVHIQGMPIDKLIDTINNHKVVSIGSVKKAWDALPQSLRNAVANKVEDWGESISGSHQREFDKSIADDEKGFEYDPSRYTEDEIKALNILTPNELKFVLRESDKLEGFEGTPEEYLARATAQVRGEPMNATDEQSAEFQKAFREYELNPELGGWRKPVPQNRDTRLDRRDLDKDFEDMTRELSDK